MYPNTVLSKKTCTNIMNLGQKPIPYSQQKLGLQRPSQPPLPIVQHISLQALHDSNPQIIAKQDT